MAGKGTKKRYAALAVRQWCEDIDGKIFETSAAALLKKLPSVTQYMMYPCEYVMNMSQYHDISLHSEIEFRLLHPPAFDDNELPLTQLTSPDNPLYKEQGVYEIDEATADILSGLYKDGSEAMKEIEKEIKLLASKHLKIALMTNRSIADVIKSKGRKLTDDELKKQVKDDEF